MTLSPKNGHKALICPSNLMPAIREVIMAAEATGGVNTPNCKSNEVAKTSIL
jgi:hypothetical protein